MKSVHFPPAFFPNTINSKFKIICQLCVTDFLSLTRGIGKNDNKWMLIYLLTYFCEITQTVYVIASQP